MGDSVWVHGGLGIGVDVGVGIGVGVSTRAIHVTAFCCITSHDLRTLRTGPD